ncbi:MAG: O-antigen ligase family protein [Caulobacteraceae bacterium]|nr:O-antigen ligase family protein [Caulobacter sp.]
MTGAATPSLDARREAALERTRLLLGALLVFAASAPFMMLLGATDDLKAPETPMLRLLWLPVYAGALLLCALSWRRLARAWLPALVCAAMCAWAWRSQAWSIAPDVTHRRVIALVMTTLLGLALGASLGARRLAQVLAAVAAVLALGSVVFAIALPHYGVMLLDGHRDWRGLWIHKNALAFVMAQGAVAAACAALSPGARRGPWLAAAVLCLGVLAMSHGTGALVDTVVALAAAGVLALLRRSALSAVVTTWATAAVAGGLALAALFAPALAFKALGKDPTLTGRTDIWAAVGRRIAEQPLAGYGYGAFWERYSIPARLIRKETGWAVPSAHNGWLDLLLQLGWIGAGLFALAAGLALVALLLRAPRTRDGGFALVYLVLFLMQTLSESVIEEPNTLAWALVVAVITCGLAPRAWRVQAPPRPAAVLPPPMWRTAPAAATPGLFAGGRP